MSVNIYARATKLTDVCGRVNYATNPEKQEHLLATASSVDQEYWERLARDSQAAFLAAGGKRTVRSKKGKMVQAKCCEAREIVMDLPNDAQEREDLGALAQEIVDDFKARTGADCVVAIHLNATEKNLHIHLIFSERELLEEPEIRIADRNAFIDEEGRRRRTKKEILGADGQLRPGCRIVPKGEAISERYFGEKNPMFKDKGWLYSYKHDAAEWINERLDPDEKREVFDKFGPYLAQRKVGKAIYSEKEEIRKVAENNQEWNRNVKIYNDLVKRGKIDRDTALQKKTQIALAPDQLQELKAVIAEAHLSADMLQPYHKKAAEAAAAKAGQGVRTKDDPEAESKRMLRDAYRRSQIAWKKYRDAYEGSLERRAALAEARAISAEILRRERELGYDRPTATSERRKAVWDAYAAYRDDAAQNEDLQAYRENVSKQRSAAWQAFSEDLEEYQDLRRRRVRGGQREQALGRLQASSARLNEARAESQMLHRAYRLQQQYRSYALELASDPNVSEVDANLALQKYKAAARRLQEPTPEKVKELQRQFSDMQRSRRIQEEKAARDQNRENR